LYTARYQGEVRVPFEVNTHKFDEVDIEELVSIAFDSRYGTILKSRNITPEKYTQVLKNYANLNNENMAILCSDSKTKKLVGWMHIYTGFPAIYFIGPWHPIVKLKQDEGLIISELISHSIDFTERSGIHTLEVHFNEMSDELEPLYQTYADWYKSSGFSKITEEAYMEIDLGNFQNITMEIQPEYEFANLSGISNTSLHDPFFEAFLNSKDILFLSQTREQQEIAFKYWFDRSEPLGKQSSFALLENDKVIGFSAVRPKGDSGDIGPIGIVPEYRRRGLGKLLLSISLNGMVAEGVKTASLEVSLENTTAINLYKSFGFKQIHSTIYHAWKSGQ
jgi:ribosomal protein S18 acetylase RimI-like enzyme